VLVTRRIGTASRVKNLRERRGRGSLGGGVLRSGCSARALAAREVDGIAHDGGTANGTRKDQDDDKVRWKEKAWLVSTANPIMDQMLLHHYENILPAFIHVHGLAFSISPPWMRLAAYSCYENRQRELTAPRYELGPRTALGNNPPLDPLPSGRCPRG
jgi:hypothetical protein